MFARKVDAPIWILGDTDCSTTIAQCLDIDGSGFQYCSGFSDFGLGYLTMLWVDSPVGIASPKRGVVGASQEVQVSSLVDDGAAWHQLLGCKGERIFFNWTIAMLQEVLSHLDIKGIWTSEGEFLLGLGSRSYQGRIDFFGGCGCPIFKIKWSCVVSREKGSPGRKMLHYEGAAQSKLHRPTQYKDLRDLRTWNCAKMAWSFSHTPTSNLIDADCQLDILQPQLNC